MAANLTILSGGAMRPLLAEAVPLFEQAQGIKAEVRFALTSVLAKEIAEGTAFDLALLPRPELDAVAASCAIAPGTQTDIARSVVGLAVRQGAPKPDISSVEALKRTLLAARSIGYSDGPSGAYVTGLLQHLGVAEEVRAKTRLTSGPVAELVANGEAEVGMQQIVAILPVKGADLVGPLPAELQNVIVYAAGIAAAAQNADGAAAFIGFMAAPEAVRIIRAKGLEPG
jgi:molybdate transport system substrate-binding protein